jgi:hypothetical protein
MLNEILAKLHREEIMAQVEKHRLAESVSEPQPPLAARLMAVLGETLSDIGDNLQRRACVAQVEWELRHAR